MSILSEMHIYVDAKGFCLYASSAKFDQLTSSSSFYYVPFVKRIYKPIYSRSINKFCRHIQNEDEIKDILVYLSTNDFHDDGQLPMNVLKEDLCTYKDGKIGNKFSTVEMTSMLESNRCGVTKYVDYHQLCEHVRAAYKVREKAKRRNKISAIEDKLAGDIESGNSSVPNNLLFNLKSPVLHTNEEEQISRRGGSRPVSASWARRKSIEIPN